MSAEDPTLESEEYPFELPLDCSTCNGSGEGMNCFQPICTECGGHGVIKPKSTQLPNLYFENQPN